MSYFHPEWLDYNYTFLRDFVAFCAARRIDVVIVEGQINPIVKSAKIDALNQMARWRFAELEARFRNVTFIPAADMYQFTSADYRDLTHVIPQAAVTYTRRLSSYLAPPVGDAVCGAAFLSGWHAKEPSGSDWFRWSGGDGTLRITSRESSDLVLEGEVLSFSRPNIIDVLADDRAIASWHIDDLAWAFHKFARIEVHVDEGTDVLVRFVSQSGPVRPASDTRALTIALKNVTLHRKADWRPCVVNSDVTSLAGGRPWR